MSDSLKMLLISWGNAFVSSFLLSVAGSLQVLGQVEWTSSFWIGLIFTGVMAGITELTKLGTPKRLGGRRA